PKMQDKVWRRGKGFEPSGGRSTAASRAAAALANGDLSACRRRRNALHPASLLNALIRYVLLPNRIDAYESHQFAQVIAKLQQKSHETMVSESECKGQSQCVGGNGDYGFRDVHGSITGLHSSCRSAQQSFSKHVTTPPAGWRNYLVNRRIL